MALHLTLSAGMQAQIPLKVFTDPESRQRSTPSYYFNEQSETSVAQQIASVQVSG